MTTVIFLRNIILSMIMISSICCANILIEDEIKSLSELEKTLSKHKIPLQGAIIAFDFDGTLFEENSESKKQTPRIEGEIKEFKSEKGNIRETIASKLIDDLKKKGAKVIGFTARKIDLDEYTRKKIEKLGITFSDDFNDIKFTLDSTNNFENQKTDESIPFINGILYTNQKEYIVNKKPLTEETRKKVKDKITIDGKTYECIPSDKGAFLERFLKVVKSKSDFTPTAVILVDDSEKCCKSFSCAFTPPKDDPFELFVRNLKGVLKDLKDKKKCDSVFSIFKPHTIKYASFLAKFKFTNEKIESQ